LKKIRAAAVNSTPLFLKSRKSRKSRTSRASH
jgi:hypothetical protein